MTSSPEVCATCAYANAVFLNNKGGFTGKCRNSRLNRGRMSWLRVKPDRPACQYYLPHGYYGLGET